MLFYQDVPVRNPTFAFNRFLCITLMSQKDGTFIRAADHAAAASANQKKLFLTTGATEVSSFP